MAIKCPVCENTSARPEFSNGGRRVECPRCGKFRITNNAMQMWEDFLESSQDKERLIANASGWIFENQDVLIGPEKIDMLKKLRAPSFHDRADMLMLAMEAKTSYAGQFISLQTADWQARAWCSNDDELYEILQYLASEGRIADTGETGTPTVKILPKGWAHLELLKASNPESPFGFVAMWFNQTMTGIYDNAIEPAITSAGYKPLRVDREEHVGKIDDFIITNIRRARFVAADLTGQRQSVYFEAGFALGLNLPVFYTCREDDIKSIHFDIRQFNCIAWHNCTELKERLTNRIIAVIGQGKQS